MTVESLPARSLKHVDVLDPLRGLASLAVVLFHYSGSILPTVRPNPFTDVFEYGLYGVHVFFVISGFVIPYSMYRSGYGFGDYGRFMARRFIRIAPPAYIAAGFVILFNLSCLWLLGRPVAGSDWPGLNAGSIMGNLLFHPSAFGSDWFNFPYWTLMIEFQFYILIGLVMPLLIDPSRTWRTIATVGCCLLLTLVDSKWFFSYSPFFLVGVVLFLWKQALIGRQVFVVLFFSSLGLCLKHDWISMCFAAVTALAIAGEFKFKGRSIIWLGKISYSLYIIHVPVAYFAETGLKRVIDIHEEPAGRIALLFSYTALVLVCAHVFNLLVERPFISIAKDLNKRKLLTMGSSAAPEINAGRSQR